MKKYIGKFIAILVILTLISVNTVAYAASKSQINNELDETNSEIDKKEGELENVQQEMSAARKEINNLNVQIQGYEEELELINDQLDELEDSIKVQEENLAAEEKNYQKQEELFHQRLIVLYESGETSYIDVLLGSENITEFLSLYYMMSEIAQADMEMLQSIEDKKQEIQINKENLES